MEIFSTLNHFSKFTVSVKLQDIYTKISAFLIFNVSLTKFYKNTISNIVESRVIFQLILSLSKAIDKQCLTIALTCDNLHWIISSLYGSVIRATVPILLLAMQT